jgi:glycosyltransferase involved in cell wall biosynthesis
MSSMQKLSAVIISFNEEKNIARCLASLKGIADEMVVLDSYSTDKTVSLAEAAGAIVFQQTFAGYIEQKNRALAHASFDFVLCLDADEELSSELQQSILQQKQNFTQDGYTMNRCTCYCGRFIKHGTWYPDTKLRLFNKQKAKWAGVNPHDKVEFSSGGSLQKLKGDLLHYSYNSLEEHIIQNNHFSTISAEAYFKKGKKFSLFSLLFNPAWSFINGYLFRMGFLDGMRGFIIAKNVAHLTFMKYYKLYALEKGIPLKKS